MIAYFVPWIISSNYSQDYFQQRKKSFWLPFPIYNSASFWAQLRSNTFTFVKSILTMTGNLLTLRKDLHTRRQVSNILVFHHKRQNQHTIAVSFISYFFGSWNCEQIEMRILPKYGNELQLIIKCSISNCLVIFVSVSSLNVFLLLHWMKTMLLALSCGDAGSNHSIHIYFSSPWALNFQFLTMLDYALEASDVTPQLTTHKIILDITANWTVFVNPDMTYNCHWQSISSKRKQLTALPSSFPEC